MAFELFLYYLVCPQGGNTVLDHCYTIEIEIVVAEQEHQTTEDSKIDNRHP